MDDDSERLVRLWQIGHLRVTDIKPEDRVSLIEAIQLCDTWTVQHGELWGSE